VLQHPLERHSAKGSARLLQLSLSCCRLVMGETFAQAELHALLGDPFGLNAQTAQQKHPILLYPHTTDAPSTPPILPTEMLRDQSRLRLIVIDGTWRKSRKLLHLNPLLKQLPRLSLQDVPLSHYVIRKAHRVDQLSTLEATCIALAQLEGNAARFDPLLKAFDGFVAQQLAQRQAGITTASKSSDTMMQL